MKYSPSEDLKESGYTWLGKVPNRWRLEPLRYHAETIVPMRDKPVELDGPIPWIRIEDFDGKFLIGSKSGQGVTQDIVRAMNLKVFPPGTVLCSCSCSMGATAITTQLLISNQTFIGLVPKDTLKSDYLYYLVQASRQRLTELATGAIQTYLSKDDFRGLKIPIPPLKIQKAIASFLDRKTAAIAILITKKQRLIQLLKEKRTALINQAVTKGLNANIPMKDSGISWIGEIPEHWKIRRFRHCGQIKNGQVDPRLPEFAQLPLYAPNHIQSGTGELVEEVGSAAEQGAISGKYLVEVGEIVYSKIRPELRKVCIAPKRGLCSADMYAISPLKGVTSKFLFWSLLSEAFSRLAILESERVAMPKINRETIADIPFAIPSEQEQNQIVESIERQTESIHRTYGMIKSQINRLQEYRQSLITSAVTGKLDVMQYSLYNR